MTFFSIISTDAITVATDRRIVPAGSVDSLVDAVDLACRLSELHRDMDERVVAAEKLGFDAGFEQGLLEGQASAMETQSERFLSLAADTERERTAIRSKAIDNALGIVRRIASRLGNSQTLAALAVEAAGELMPTAVVLVQVHPDQVAAVRLRLSELQKSESAIAPDNDDPGQVLKPPMGLTYLVEAEESLETGQCRLRSESGAVVLAGLETQLRSIERQARDVSTYASQVPPASECHDTSAVAKRPMEGSTT